jgi:hypothetical protein
VVIKGGELLQVSFTWKSSTGERHLKEKLPLQGFAPFQLYLSFTLLNTHRFYIFVI